jgi:hypothetical protein
MDDGFRSRLNRLGRETGKTQEELLAELRAEIGMEPKGLRKWVEAVKSSLRRPTETDRENRRIFEENKAREAAASGETFAEKLKAAGLGKAPGTPLDGNGPIGR